MNLQKFKKLTAVAICVMLVLSMCITGSSVSAATKTETNAVGSNSNANVVSDVETTIATESTATTVATEPTVATVATEPSEEANEPSENTAVVSEPAEEENISIFFYNDVFESNGWDYWGNVYAYYWDETEGDMVQWPGKQMSTYGEYEYGHVYEMVVSIPATAKHITFHNNNGSQIANLTVEGADKIYKHEEWVDMERTICFDNRVTDWDSVYAYYWSESDNSMVQWPGVEIFADPEYDYYKWLYKAQVPLDATHIIFHNNDGAQISDLVIPNGAYMTFSSFAKEWLFGESEIQTATAEADICMVAGSSELCGSEWDGDLSTSYDNAMDKTGEPNYAYDDYYYRYVGEYEKTYEDVQPATGLQLKVVSHFYDAGHTYSSDLLHFVDWYGNENGNRVTFNVTKTCDVKIKFNYTTKEVTVTGDGVEIVDDLPIESMYAIGNGSGNWLNGAYWYPYYESNQMTEIEHNVYQIKYEDVAASDSYEFKFGANGSWENLWSGDYEGSDVESDALYNPVDKNIVFANPYEIADITLTIDLDAFNPATKEGAKFKVYVDDKTTSLIKVVVPKTAKSAKCWDNGVYLAYSKDYNPSTFTKLALTKTSEYKSPELYTDSLIEGTYSVYSINLTKEQIDAINKAPYVAIMNSSNAYRTYASGKYNILKAPVDEYSEEYNTTKTDVADLDGYTFVMNNEVETGTSIQGYATFTGYWQNPSDKEEPITIKVVVPSATNWNNCWKQGVYLAYSNSYELDSFTKIEMTKTEDTYWPSIYTEYLVDESCYIYTVTLTGAQAEAINNSDYVAFMNKSGTYRTYVNKNYNVFKANFWYVGYNTEKSTVASHSGNIFVVCDSVQTGTSIEGYGTFTGYWSEWY